MTWTAWSGGRVREAGCVLEIRVLGAPEFAYAGAPFRFAAPPKALPLLARLLVHRRAPLARDALAFAMWPDVDEESARSDLRRHLYYLGKALPPPNGVPWIVADKRSVGWNAAAHAALDLDAFERHLDAGTDLEAAVALYRGPFLDGYDDAWVEPERERLKGRAEAALLTLIERHERVDPERATAFARQLLAVDPWREDAIRSLMRARRRAGDRAGALAAYRSFAERLRRDLDVAPMPETVAVYAAIADGVPDPEADDGGLANDAVPRTNVPAPVDATIGRETALDEVRALLGASRIVTLTGTGGVGKTRLAGDAGRSVLEGLPDGVWFADLGPLADPALVVPTIAAALGVAWATERPEPANVLAAIRGKRLLLIVDTCEHLVAETARVVAALLAGAPDVRILATSREPLGVRGERVYRVPSLDVPPAGATPLVERARTFGAVALFEARAIASDPHFVLDAGNVADVVEICRRLDGIALALELAAARVTMLAPAEIIRRLRERFALLGGGERTALPRQRTMRALLDWSWELCSESERVLFRRLAVFGGGWTLAALEAVCCTEPAERASVVERMGALVAKSLAIAEPRAGGTRYRLLETLRAYALERLAASGEGDALAARHAAWTCAFAEAVDVAYQTEPDATWFERATAELDNVRVALDATLGAPGDPAPAPDAARGARLASAFGTVWHFGTNRADRRSLDRAYERLDRRAHPALTVRLLWQIAAISHADAYRAEWIAAAVRDRGDRRTRADAACWLAETHLRSGRLDDARGALAEAVELQDAVERPKAFALLERLRGELAARDGEPAAAYAHFRRAIASGTASGAIALVASARLALAELDYASGDYDAARAAAYEAGRSLRAAFGRTVAYVDATAALASYALAAGDVATARHEAAKALARARDLDYPERAVAAIETLALAAACAGEPARAAWLAGFCESERARRAGTPRRVERDALARLHERLAGALEPATLAEQCALGAIAGLDRAIAEALRP